MNEAGRWLCGLLAMLLCGFVWTAPTVVAQNDGNSALDEDSGIAVDTSGDNSYDVFTYRENESGVTITSCDTSATDVEIPAEIDGKPVTEIGDAAFMNCVVLTSLEVPEHVTKIGESAFNACSMLCTVALPEGLTQMGKGAFESCEMLSQVEIPSTLTALPDALFYNCSYLPSLVLPDTVRSIGSEAFYSCTALTEITLPEGLEQIGDYAFQNCQKLEEVHLPASCMELGNYAFDGCQALTTFTVAEENPSYAAEDGVLFSADGATLIRYPQARAETAYTVPEGCETLADWSFIGATTLEQIDMGNVTKIGEDCFYYCTALKEIMIPEGVTELVGAAFAYCMSLERVTLPSTIQKLGDHCFYSCAKLAEVNVPEGVTTLGDRCFYNCVALMELTLPASVSEIGEEAIGYYTPSDAGDGDKAERIALLQVHNEGSDAVEEYLRSWRDGSYIGWVIAGSVVVVLVGGVTALVLVHRNRNKIRPTSRNAPEKGRKSSRKKK